jgi:membrane protein
MKFWSGLLPVLNETWSEYLNDEANERGAALAYYAAFSLFPLLILLLAALGFVLDHVPAAVDARAALLRLAARQVSPQFSRTLREVFGQLQEHAPRATGIGLFILWFGASSVFQQLDHTFNKIWRVPEKSPPTDWKKYALGIIKDQLTRRLAAFLMVLVVGLLLFVSLALTAIVQPLLGVIADVPLVGSTVGYLASMAISLILNTLLFALLFKYLPDTPVAWGDVWLGALLTALIWELTKRLLALYIAHSSYISAYGVVGTMLVLLVWIYFSSQVLFLGAEFTEVYSRRYGSRLGQRKAPEPVSQ